MRKQLGETIKLARKAKKLKLKHVATELGVTIAYVHNIEAARAPLPWHYMAKLSKLLGISVEILALATLYGSHEYECYTNVIANKDVA